MAKSHTGVLITAVIIATAGAYYIWQLEKQPDQQPAVEKQTLILPEKEEKPIVRFPVPAPEETLYVEPEESREPEAPVVEEKPLPPLNESDEVIRQEFVQLFDQPHFLQLFIFKTFVHRFVVTVDNLMSQKLPQKFRLTYPPPGKFLVHRESPDKQFIDPANDQRYKAFVQFLQAMDTDKMVTLYIHYYPLFQQAYEDLGYPDHYFNDRLIEVIDHLLGAPEINEPIELVRPSVYYKFANPELEALSAGEKLMIRIGYENSRSVKQKLRELRRSLSTLMDRS